LFLLGKKKEIIIIVIYIYIIIVIYIYIIIYIIIIIKRDENRRGEKKTHWREKKSGGDKKIAVARGKSQEEKFFKDFLNIKKSSKRLTYCFLNHEKISVLKLLL